MEIRLSSIFLVLAGGGIKRTGKNEIRKNFENQALEVVNWR